MSSRNGNLSQLQIKALSQENAYAHIKLDPNLGQHQKHILSFKHLLRFKRVLNSIDLNGVQCMLNVKYVHKCYYELRPQKGVSL